MTNKKLVGILGALGAAGVAYGVSKVVDLGTKISQFYQDRNFLPVAGDVGGGISALVSGYKFNLRGGLASYGIMVFFDLLERFGKSEYNIGQHLFGDAAIAAAAFGAGALTRIVSGGERVGLLKKLTEDRYAGRTQGRVS